ncbi:hypothetical protein Tco_0784699 [Tanacetum coccineum]
MLKFKSIQEKQPFLEYVLFNRHFLSSGQKTETQHQRQKPLPLLEGAEAGASRETQSNVINYQNNVTLLVAPPLSELSIFYRLVPSPGQRSRDEEDTLSKDFNKQPQHVQVKDIVKEVKNYLKTYSLADPDIS